MGYIGCIDLGCQGLGFRLERFRFSVLGHAMHFSHRRWREDFLRARQQPLERTISQARAIGFSPKP